jgi:hypothetical protein
MEVSTFELLYKPLTPTGGDIARRVLQGYFLTLTNLENNDYLYRIEFTVTTPTPYSAERTLDSPQALFISDVASPDNVFAEPLKIGSSTRYYRNITVKARQTALIVLLPNISLPSFFATAPANQEVRGFVRITLPCVFKPGSPFGFFGPQSNTPVKVLLNPESRATYLPNGWPSAPMSAQDFDQTITALTVASGKGLNEIPPGSCFFTINDLVARGVLERLAQATAATDPTERLTELVAGLLETTGDAEGVRMLNALLEQAGAPVSVSARNGKKPQRS